MEMDTGTTVTTVTTMKTMNAVITDGAIRTVTKSESY
jgi:hypothetical protein